MTVVLGVDYGEVRIGLAVSDELMIAANPLALVKRSAEGKDLQTIREVIQEKGVGRVVVGLPLNMDGSEGPMAKAARAFAEEIAALGVEVVLWDERLSSHAAESALIEADVSRKKRKGRRDKVAAAWFLQSYLDSVRRT